MVRGKGNWKQLLCGIAGFLLVLSAGSINSMAAEQAAEQTPENLVTVVDDASLLMEEEADWLYDVAEELAEKSDWNVIVATCEDAEGKSTQTVCEDYFNAYTTGDDGISCLVDMDNREIYIATAGEAQLYLNDSRIDALLDEAYEAVSEEDYCQCLYLMVLRSSEAYDAGIPDNAKIYNEDTGETVVYHKLTFLEILVSILAALAVGGIIFGAIVGKYRLKWGTYHYDFHESGSMDLQKQDDRFINQVVTHRRIPKNDSGSSSGGGGHTSTVHTGSGGRSFGGGGRKF